MNAHRAAAIAAVTCAAVLSVAACTAGITSAGPSAPAAASSTAASRPSGSATSGLASTMVSVGGPIGHFPVPAGATVVENASEGNETVILLSSVSPSEVSQFYTAELPRDGFTITSNSMASLSAGSDGGIGAGAAIEFSGHGYKGTIGAVANLPTSAPSFGGSNGKNFVGITLTRQ